MSKNTVLVVVLVFSFLVLIASGYFTYRWWQNKKIEEKQAEELLNQENAEEIAAASGEVETTDNQNYPESAVTNEGWLLYKNYQNNFLIEYPSEAKIEYMNDPTTNDIRYSKCVKISTDNYYILVGSVPSSDDPIFCFRTGVGTEWGQGPTETVTAAGMEYTITGMHTEAASAGYYKDFFMISPVDGRVKIEYGIDVNEKYGTISKTSAKEIVHKIIASYSPAE